MILEHPFIYAHFGGEQVSLIHLGTSDIKVNAHPKLNGKNATRFENSNYRYQNIFCKLVLLKLQYIY